MLEGIFGKRQWDREHVEANLWASNARHAECIWKRGRDTSNGQVYCIIMRMCGIFADTLRKQHFIFPFLKV